MTPSPHYQPIEMVGSAVTAPILSRAKLEAGEIEDIIARDAPGLRLLTESERRASLAAFLRDRLDGPVWLFGYGSLIWNPAIRTAEQRTARIEGWHRDFCLSVTAGRGSPEQPGLVLALDRGGHCTGKAFRIAEDDVDAELTLVWQREMLCGAYSPKWVEIFDLDGVAFGHAIAFTINHASEQYVADLPMESVVRRLATAKGGFGTAADYLFRTRDGLRASGIPDLHLERLASRVEALQEVRERALC